MIADERKRTVQAAYVIHDDLVRMREPQGEAAFLWVLERKPV